ncbi:hypothetical protein N4T77_11715 [Clostridium sp. CX1]|uniref:hypothetical protein n=1 Tax=Clostridium sp. CX1 TaxID=2978346 RepID=UPI0021C1518F|nr:hypothetical protein [Clostridium sp. CX1]MCT8977271.1 hypothetical protein [Clostridium sp. CX1]
MIKIKFHANWCSDYEIREHFNRCTTNNDYTWKNLFITLDDDYDFFVIMNHPQHNNFPPSKTIVFQCEPESTRMCWGNFYKPDSKAFFKVYDTEHNHNVDKWFIGLNYQQLLNGNFSKNKVMSGIVSGIYNLEGHVDRFNFLKYLDKLPFYEHFGKGDLGFLKSFKGYLPNKEDGLISYRYHFNAENVYEKNYFTEKIIDPILCECLCFYDGCPNIEEFIDSRAYIKINLKKPDESLETIKWSIENNEYEKRIPFIKKEKEKLMNELNPLNIIYKIIRGEI